LPQVDGIQASGITTLNGVSVAGAVKNYNGISIQFGNATPTPTTSVTVTKTPTQTITPSVTNGALLRVMINGSFNNINNDTRYYVARSNGAGATDTTWPYGGGTQFNDTCGSPMRTQSDGKQIYAGSFTSYNGTSAGYICRLYPDGVLDTTFNSGGVGFNGIVQAIWVNTDNTIVAVGQFTTYNGTSSNRIIKLNSDGTINGTFNVGTGLNGQGVWVEKYGSYYYIGGDFTTYNGTSYLRFVVLDDNGTVIGPDAAGKGANGIIYDLKVDSTHVYIGGDFTTWNGSSVASDLVKVSTSTWNADSTFNTNINGGSNNSVRGLLLDSATNVLYVGGNFTSFSGNTSYGSRLLALNTDGTSYTSFNNNRTTPSNFVRRMNWSNITQGYFYIMGAFVDYGGVGLRDRIALISKTNGTIDSYTCNIYGGPGQEPFWAHDFYFIATTPTATPTPTNTPTKTVTPTNTATNTPTKTVTPTPTPTVPTACNTVTLYYGNTLDEACFPSGGGSSYDINGTDLSDSSIIYDTGFSCQAGKEAASGYYKDTNGNTKYWNGTSLSGQTCPPCNLINVAYDNTSDRLACYGTNYVNVYIDGNDFSDPITRLWNSCVWNDVAPNGYYYDGTSSTLVYWNGSTVTKPSCPPCYLLMLYAGPVNDICNCFVFNTGYYTDAATLASSSGIWTDCTFQTTANTNYYSENCGTGSDVYDWTPNILSYFYTCP